MTTGEKIWKDAVTKLGVFAILGNPEKMVPELGREVIRRVDELVHHLTLDLDLYDQENSAI